MSGFSVLDVVDADEYEYKPTSMKRADFEPEPEPQPEHKRHQTSQPPQGQDDALVFPLVPYVFLSKDDGPRYPRLTIPLFTIDKPCLLDAALPLYPFPVRDDDEYLDRTKVYSCGKEHGSIGHAQGRLAASLATNNYLCQPATQRWLKAVAEHGNQPEIVADRGMGGKKELWPFLLPISTWQIRPLKKHEKYVPPPLLDIAAFVPCESHKKQRQAEEGCVACLAGFCLPCQKRVADGGKSRGLCDMCPRDREDIVKQQTTAAKDQEEQKPNPLEFKVWAQVHGQHSVFRLPPQLLVFQPVAMWIDEVYDNNKLAIEADRPTRQALQHLKVGEALPSRWDEPGMIQFLDSSLACHPLATSYGTSSNANPNEKNHPDQFDFLIIRRMSHKHTPRFYPRLPENAHDLVQPHFHPLHTTTGAIVSCTQMQSRVLVAPTLINLQCVGSEADPYHSALYMGPTWVVVVESSVSD